MDIEAASDEDAFEDARERVERPMWRLFTEYGRGQRFAFVVGLVSSIFARMLDLLPPLLLALAIDAVIENDVNRLEKSLNDGLNSSSRLVISVLGIAACLFYANLRAVQAGEIDELPEEFVQRAIRRRARTDADD